LDIPEAKTDFGLTLAKWGVTESPYFVIPLLGPSTIRDGIGKGVDFFLQPINILALNPNNQTINDLDWVRLGAEVLDTRARALTITDDIKLNSVDPYATMRSMYLQNRRHSISADMKVIDRGVPRKENYDFDFSADY
jgi:phospholipid-binding lipoprotein MlaA